MQKLVRAGFGNNNVDTCARVCHSPTGYGLKNTLGESAGTQNFDSVDGKRRHLRDRREPDRWPSGVRLADEAPPAPGRETDRRRSAAHRPGAHAARRADYHLQLRPGTNVALINSLAHVIVTEGLVDEAFVRERCDVPSFEKWRKFVAEERNSPEAMEAVTGVPAASVRAAARLYATGGNGAIYYGLGVTEHSQGSTMVMGIANLAMATGNIGRAGRRRQPAARPEQRAGLLRHGLLPARIPRLPPRVRMTRCDTCSRAPGACPC